MPDLYSYIAERIRELRQLNQLNQEEFAKKIGVSATNTISRWETATYKPSAEELEKMAKVFNVSISYFFPDETKPQIKGSLQALMSATAGLTEKDLKELTEYAEFRKARAVLNAAKRSKTR